ncbi:MAG: hypothetical protein E6I96_16580 [Chloroflexi bacterium]|nr:MAG: hypothetical protein E6I96_16580 [Chloroflexota bacterium]
MDRVGDAFVWPFRDPQWLEKLAIIGLILLIPIVGAINAIGWMLATIDRLRAGEERLPPANFSYLGRGFELFVVFLVYGLGVLIVAAHRTRHRPRIGRLPVVLGYGVRRNRRRWRRRWWWRGWRDRPLRLGTQRRRALAITTR